MSIQTTTAHILRTESLTKDILQVVLSPMHYIPYQAGQYLQILAANHEALFYSIANAPHQTHTYEIHIRHHQEIPNLEPLIHEIISQQTLILKLPLGTCTLESLNKERPLILIAGGTGIAPMKAMLEQLCIEKHTSPLTLYWLVRTEVDLYMNDEILKLQKEIPQLQYIPYISNSNKISLTALKHIHDLKAAEIILAGPFNMVYALRDELIAQGVAKKHLHADAFAFENQ